MFLGFRLLLLNSIRFAGKLVVMIIAEDSKLARTTARETRGGSVLSWHIDGDFE
jgi:hypothetical protein